MTRVALLWHMHQPYYEDLVTHEHLLPWARLHALKDYYGMAALLREFPDIRVTFNLVPSLLVQIDAFAEGRASDRYLDVGLRPASDLTDADRAFMVENFFHANRSRLINVYPRYAELLAASGGAVTPDAIRSAARRLAVDELRDLQVWQKLSWFDQSYLSAPGVARDLVQKGRGFTEADKAALREEELRLLRAVIPEYRAAADAGTAELSTSPFYHPILPLLCDTGTYARTHPDAPKPRRPFVHPEEAAEQLRRAVAYHEHVFGRRPTGLWPSEGSVSDDVVRLAAEAGFAWMATDELVLARTLGIEFHRDGRGVVQQPGVLYRPYRLGTAPHQVGCVFRDHELSDRIGFSYAGWPADAAAEDFVGRVVDAGRAGAATGGGEEPLVAVVLDGENPWEYYAYGGRPFLRALYRRLSGHPELRTVLMSEACGDTSGAAPLPSIFPGSWIDANFSIWIGHDDDRRAWSQLSDAHDAVTSASDAPAQLVERAREELLIAEGSDWFWWYGDDHSSAHDEAFDDLFRRHVRNAYALLNKPIPAELFQTNITTKRAEGEVNGPCGLLHPTIDGEATSYFEWLGAGYLDAAAGAMHQAVPDLLRDVLFGCSEERLFVRVGGVRPLRELLSEGHAVSFDFIRPAGVRLVVSGPAASSVAGAPGPAAVPAAFMWDGARWVPHEVDGIQAAAGSILELSAPFRGLGLSEGDVRFSVVLKSPDGVVREHHPRDGAVTVAIPDGQFAARHWTA